MIAVVQIKEVLCFRTLRMLNLQCQFKVMIVESTYLSLCTKTHGQLWQVCKIQHCLESSQHWNDGKGTYSQFTASSFGTPSPGKWSVTREMKVNSTILYNWLFYSRECFVLPLLIRGCWICSICWSVYWINIQEAKYKCTKWVQNWWSASWISRILLLQFSRIWIE